MKKGEHSYHTNNKVVGEYSNRFISLAESKTYIKENCVLIETKVFSHFNQENPTNALVSLNNCSALIENLIII